MRKIGSRAQPFSFPARRKAHVRAVSLPQTSSVDHRSGDAWSCAFEAQCRGVESSHGDRTIQLEGFMLCVCTCQQSYNAFGKRSIFLPRISYCEAVGEVSTNGAQHLEELDPVDRKSKVLEGNYRCVDSTKCTREWLSERVSPWAHAYSRRLPKRYINTLMLLHQRFRPRVSRNVDCFSSKINTIWARQ